MVVRYQPEGHDYEISQEDDGDFVYYEDYVELEKKYHDLCEKVRELWMEIP